MTVGSPRPRSVTGWNRLIPAGTVDSSGQLLVLPLVLVLFMGGCGYGRDIGQGAADAGLGLFESVLFISAILVVVILVGGVIAMFARRRYRSPGDAPTIGFTLEDLRLMHERGQLSLEEFENAREKMLSKVRGSDNSRPAASESRISGRIPPPRTNQGGLKPNQDD